MNSFPANAIPQFQMPPGQHLPPDFQQQMQQQQPPPGMDPQHLAMLQQQGYIAQQQQLAAMQASGMQLPPGMMRPGMPPQAMPKKKKQSRPTPQQQMLPRHMQPPHGNEHYMKQAMAPPGMQQPGQQLPPGAVAPGAMGMDEPFADMLDEADPRELAMQRFRARHEIMTEVFGPERIQDIPLTSTDPWVGLGMDGETLEAKVAALESSNAELEAKFDADLEAWRKRLEEAGSGEGVAA